MTSDFKIISMEGLLDDCGTLRTASQELNDLVESLNNNLTKLDGYWQNESGSDKQSYIQEVKGCANYLVNIAGSGVSFASSMEKLREDTIQNQSKTIY